MGDSSKRPVLDHRYDVTGNSAARQTMHYARMKIGIMGNYSSGPGIRCLATLMFLHYLGRPLFRLRTLANNQHSLKRKLKGLLARIRPQRSEEAG